MKKILVATVLMLTSLMTLAHGPHGPQVYYQYRQHDNNWVAPAILGGLIVYAATRPTVVVQQPAPVPIPVCGPWIEIRNSDGTITQSRTCQ